MQFSMKRLADDAPFDSIVGRSDTGMSGRLFDLFTLECRNDG